MMLILYLFLISLLTKIKTHVHLKVDLLYDDYCTDVLINGISIKDKINLDTESQYYFRTINFTANVGDIIKFVTLNVKSIGGIAARLTIFCNGNQYEFSTKNNEELFPYNITDNIRRNQLSLQFYYEQDVRIIFLKALINSVKCVYLN